MKRAFLFLQRNWGLRIGHPLASLLVKNGYEVAGLVIKQENLPFYLNQKEVDYKMLVDSDRIKNDPKAFLNNDPISLDEICNDLAIESIWVLVQALRNHTKNYKRKYYYSFIKSVSDDEIVAYVKAVFKNIKHIFTEFNPDVLIMPNYASLQHILFSLYAKNRGVQVIGGADARFRGRVTFMYDYLQRDGQIHRILRNPNGPLTPNERKNVECIVSEETQKLKENASKSIAAPRLFLTWQEELAPFWGALKYILQSRFLSWTGGTLDAAGVLLIRDWFKRKEYIYKNLRYQYEDLNQFKKFIYVPLQFQPEMTIDVFAARMNNQLEFIRQVAMSCPGDYVVVTKDHPAMIERRAPSYLNKIAKLPNVKLVSPLVRSETILEKADLVVTPNGTTCVDCAFLKKPVIQMGDLGLTLIYPNVIKVTEWASLSKAMRTAKNMKFDREYDERLLRVVHAVLRGSYQFDLNGIWEKGSLEKKDDFLNVFLNNIDQLLADKNYSSNTPL